ncbi:hypothetical protein LP114_036 [Listeria phage LP-114]|uniref:Uncharacterized protein n=1 Tax=Listeria phage LP-114 TaxID=1458857 RepID=A0A059T635_9CAUD|nr:hypothetical protein LP114_036 [Listeria phage LP-114]AHL18624.1 hypothetical protein LP114_036 [Listeria phage LP-114]
MMNKKIDRMLYDYAIQTILEGYTGACLPFKRLGKDLKRYINRIIKIEFLTLIVLAGFFIFTTLWAIVTVDTDGSYNAYEGFKIGIFLLSIVVSCLLIWLLLVKERHTDGMDFGDTFKTKIIWIKAKREVTKITKMIEEEKEIRYGVDEELRKAPYKYDSFAKVIYCNKDKYGHLLPDYVEFLKRVSEQAVIVKVCYDLDYPEKLAKDCEEALEEIDLLEDRMKKKFFEAEEQLAKTKQELAENQIKWVKKLIIDGRKNRERN